MHIDIAAKHPDAQVRQDADDLVALMIPIVKAYMTDMGFEVSNLAIEETARRIIRIVEERRLETRPARAAKK